MIFIRKRFSQINAENYVKYLKSKTDMKFKSALDIGAGFGHVVKELRKYDIDAHGLDKDQSTVELSITDNLTYDTFDKNYKSKQKYDLICIMNSIYYIDDTFEILKLLKTMLNPSGFLFISTIDPDSPEIKPTLSTSAYGKQNILTKTDFQSLKERIGLEVIDITHYRNNFHSEFGLMKIKKKTKIVFIINTFMYFLKLKKIISYDKIGDNLFILLKNKK